MGDFTGELQASDPAATVTQDPVPGTQLDLGTNLLTFTVTETNGISICTMFITVVDTVGPVLVGGTNKTVECGSAWSFDEPVAWDDCSGTNVTVVVVGTTIAGATWTRTWAASDAVGNSNTWSQVVSVVDTVGPVLVGGTNKTVECGSAWSFDEPVAWDDCSGTNATVVVVGTTIAGATWTRTWAASDAVGNSNTWSQVVSVVDTVGPVLVGGTNKTVECGSAWSFDEPVAWDDCSGTNVTVVVVGTTIAGATWTRTWAASDAVGNSNTWSQVVERGGHGGAGVGGRDEQDGGMRECVEF
ncbi:MAG: hypothetical protein QM813_12495 [Verrucomicrobiota bacterium]